MTTQSLKRILYAEDDADILEITVEALETFGGFDVVTCTSGAGVVARAHEFHPDLVLLDVMMPDVDGVMALKALHAEAGFEKIPVIFLTAKYKQGDVENLKKLGAIDVISKPFHLPSLSGQILAAWDKFQVMDTGDSLRSMAGMQEKFKANLGGRLEDLKSALDGMVSSGSARECQKSMENLLGLSHKLRGAASTFGFAALSVAAEELEERTTEVLNSIWPPGDSELDSLQQMLSLLQKLAETEPSVTVRDIANWELLAKKLNVGEERAKDVVIVDDDASFADVLKNQLTYFGFAVTHLDDHTKLQGYLSNHSPSVVLMDICFPGDMDAGVNTVNALKENGTLVCPVILLSIRGDVQARLNAVRLGCAGYLQKPVDVIEVVEHLNRLTDRVVAEPFRVIIIDDDQEVAELNAALLQQAGAEVIVVTDPIKSISAIRELSPDVILMDIHMPECDGFELSNVIRQHKTFMQIPIVFLSGTKMEDAWLQAVYAGGDEFLRKNIEPKELVAVVLARARRNRDYKSAIDRLEESEKRYRGLADSASEAIISTDVEGHIVYWNDSAANVFGYDTTEILGKPFFTLIHEMYQEFYAKAFQRAALGKKPEVKDRLVEAFGRRKDGSDVPIEISFTDWEVENQTYFTSIIRDVTSRKNEEAKLRKKQDLIDLMHSVTRLANNATDWDTALHDSLTAMCGFLRCPVGHVFVQSPDNPNSLISSNIWYLEDPVKFAAFREITSRTEFSQGEGLPGRVLESGQVARIEDVTLDDNSPRAQSAVKLEIRGAVALPIEVRGSVVAVMELFTITRGPEIDTELNFVLSNIGIQLGLVLDRMMAKDHLQEAKAQAEAANRAKSEFISSMSHELRTPLNAIIGFGQMLGFNPREQLSKTQETCVNHILSGGEHLLDLVDDILDLAKIEVGKVSISTEDILPTEILEECLPLIAPLAAKRGIDIVVPDAAVDIPMVRADHKRFKQVLLNLMSNAVKYNRENGSIFISFEETARDTLRITVTDTGAGIPKARQNELYKPFSRLGAENSEVEGTGVGLVICKNLVELMQGTLGFESEQGKGSAFWFELPLVTGEQTSAEAGDAFHGSQEQGVIPDMNGTLLYIEDNPSNQELMEMIVSRIEGLSLLSAKTAEQGIEIASIKRPDIILLDINLPGMDGIEALKRLQKLESIKNTPVLALSASATQVDIDKGMQAGFLRYLTKPFQVVEMTNAIRNALEDQVIG